MYFAVKYIYCFLVKLILNNLDILIFETTYISVELQNDQQFGTMHLFIILFLITPRE